MKEYPTDCKHMVRWIEGDYCLLHEKLFCNDRLECYEGWCDECDDYERRN